MENKTFWDDIIEKFTQVVVEHDLLDENIQIQAKTLEPIEAIGVTKRKDYPILTGKELMLQAEFNGSIGQAFTASPASFHGSLKDILELDVKSDVYAKGLFIATLNAVMRHLGLIKGTIHCKNEEPEVCSEKIVSYIDDNYGDVNVALVGYQPAMLEALAKNHKIRVLDLDDKNINAVRYGVKVEHGIENYEEVVNQWADVVLCTGSTICNDSVANFLDKKTDVLFFGTTLAGVAELLELKRVCFCSL